MATDVRFTLCQRQAIEDRLDEMLVSASAGSGKTTVMIERILSLVREGVELKNMAVVTFTKASAADMRTKLYKALSKESLDGNEFAFKQLRTLPSAQISTLHSFCQQLIKSYFYAIKTDPDFMILSETDSKTLLRECIDREIERQLRDGNSDFAVVYDVMLQNRKTTALSDCIERIYEFASSQPDFDVWIDHASSKAKFHDEHIAAMKAELEGEFLAKERAAESLLNRTAKAEFKRNLAAAEGLFEAVRRRERCEARVYGKLPDDFYLLELNSEFSELKADYNKLFDKKSGIENSADPIRALEYLKVLLDMTRNVRLDYGEQKQKDGLKDYSDLEHDALKILMNDEVKRQVDARYKYLFVDEYQDINPLQESIISVFNAKKFFVGDVKQSIYSFRMCTPEIFLAKRARLKKCEDGSGEALELNSNFRSNANILRFCNEAFSRIMSDGFGGCDYKTDAAFVIEGDENGVGDLESDFDSSADESAEVAATLNSYLPNVEMFLVSGKAGDKSCINGVYSVKEHEEESNSDLKDAEINMIIGHIARLIAPKQSGGEGAEFKDIAVLLRSVSCDYAVRLKNALNNNGIPAFLQEKKNALDNVAVATLVAYLKLIDNHDDDVAFATSLRSPLGGLNDGELAEIKRCYSGKGRYFYEAVASSVDNESVRKSIRQKLEIFFERLNRFTDLSYSKNASQIMGDIISEFDYFKYVFATRDGEVKARELAAFLAYAEESLYKSSVGEFVRALDREMPKLQLLGAADAVNIMTVHASKGLEFPYVILGNLSKEHNTQDLRKQLLLDSELGAALKVWDLENHTKLNSSLYMRIASKMKRRAFEEEARILYVAMTRAKNGLALFACVEDEDKIRIVPPSKASSFFELLAPQFLKYAERFGMDDCNFDSNPERVLIHNKEANVELVECIKGYINLKTVDKEALPVKAVVTKLAKIESSETDEEYDSFLKGKVNSLAASKGSAYHVFLEKVDFGFSSEEEEWRRLNGLYPDFEGLVDRRVFFEAVYELKDFIGGKRFFREKPFVCSLDARDVLPLDEARFDKDGSILVQGVIDLIIEEKDGYIIVDYKSGKIEGSSLASYTKQLNIYALAAAKILKKPITKRVIFSIGGMNFIQV